MEKLKVEFQFCYGIKKLEYEFVFSNRAYAIYAPNGVMKSSFAKTFMDIAEGRNTQDLAFPNRKTKRDIKLDDDKDIASDSIFVVEHYNETYESDKITTLLAKKSLKKEYDEIHKSIDKIKNEFYKKLKVLSGLQPNKIENEILSVFDEKDIFEVLQKLRDTIIKEHSDGLENIEYKKIFTPDALKFIEENKEEIEEYIKRYEELIEKSKYLKKDFNIHHIETVTKQLGSNHFFKAGHSVNLSDGSEKKEYNSDKSLQELIKKEKEQVLSDPKLKSKFEAIDKKLSNAKLREFRDYLLDYKEILPLLSNINKFAQNLWVAYFSKEKDTFNQLIDEYKVGENRIKKLVENAKKEQTDWEVAIEIFNNRFVHLPFYLRINNKDDVILKGEVPVVNFVFKDGEDEKVYSDKNQLLRLLSTGEQRALYILNIIFEIEARRKLDQEHLLIIDDIADSFDYKNKYAIIDYLRYISELENFYMIILTHNFDFFRTINGRGITANRKQCLFAIKSDEGIELQQAQYLKNPFTNVFKHHLNDNKKLIASIPFIRNIIEYTKEEDDQDYLKLTSLLHIKDDTNSISLDNLKDIFTSVIPDLNFPNENLDIKVIDLIFQTADSCLSMSEGINLEHKIVLSIAIRLKAEQFIIEQINDDEFIKSINRNQTWKLLKKFEEIFNNEKEVLEILKRINLITPENIHINSFMYEPIIDMGDGELKKLYTDTKKLNEYMIEENRNA